MAEEIVRLHKAVTGRDEINVQKFKWVEDLGMSDFFSWLKTIGHENVVTEKERELYDYLKAHGQLAGEEAESKLAEIFPVEDDHTVDHEAVLEQLNNENAEKERLLKHLKKVEETLRGQLKCLKEVPKCSKGEETLINNSKIYKENCERLFHESENFHRAFENLRKEIPSNENSEKFIVNQENKIFFENLQILYKIVEDVRAKFFNQEDSDEFLPDYINNHLDKCMETFSILEKELEESKIELNWLDEAIKFVVELNVDDVGLEERKMVLMQEKTPDLSAEIRKLGDKRAMNQNHRMQIEVLGDNEFLDRLQGRLQMMKDFYEVCRPLRVLSEVYTRLIEAEGVKAKASLASLISAFDSTVILAKKYEEVKENFEKFYSAKLDSKKNQEIVTDFLDLNQSLIHEEKLFFDKVKFFFSQVNEVLSKVKKGNEILLNGQSKMSNIMLPELYFEVETKLKEATASLDNLVEKYENLKKNVEY